MMGGIVLRRHLMRYLPAAAMYPVSDGRRQRAGVTSLFYAYCMCFVATCWYFRVGPACCSGQGCIRPRSHYRSLSVPFEIEGNVFFASV